ncbi:MAG: 5-dehydro-2-deoxygluconokinase, partial [Hyphomicrobiales bacterium]|nr:5-dehydro-2-deoxygluconokinase [Hyphomicrobiales bacterium]
MAADADEFALPATRLDVITIGRSSVDLYGQQIGSRLEDVATFAKSVGGCPSNIAIGTARLGLRSGLITRVGDEQMGRYILEQMARENVATDGIVTDPERLSALVLLSVENDETFPLIFYRENCADMALCEDDIDADFVSSAKAIVVSGTHFSQANTDAAQRKAIRIARDAGRKVVFDIDYRPNLWRLTGHAAGEERYIASRWVTKRLKSVLADCDLIVGTEEEIHIAAGQEDTLAALRAIRDISDAAIVLKRGPMGCVVYPGAIPGQIEDGIVGAGFPVEVYNVLGAGDAFMSGFLRGWLCDESLATCATWANACGAFAVSRLLCSPEIPTWAELQYFLENGSPHRALRHDAQINHVHWSTTRRPQPSRLMVLAIDHRAQMLAMAEAVGAPPERISAFKTLAVEATARIADGRPGYGVLLDETYGRKAMVLAAENGLWIGRPVEDPGSRPLRFEVSQDIGGRINEWPVTHTVKCLAFYHPDDNPALKAEQTDKLQTLHEAVRRAGRELLVEIIASKNGPLDNNTTARVLAELYAFGIKPDWWKLEPQASPGAWQGIEKVVSANDSRCRGIVLLGLDAPQDKLLEGFAACTDIPLVRGFAIGRTVFNSAASKWLAG